ncbi:RagB/SusD family nutrient uptake outer membrane protein [Chitinophagaceae bacterium 26-R-25]|nr:RagB/SusD family nutrient uptake outer membrane protein [Chitinophagaceae bacterium 26-R-25]
MKTKYKILATLVGVGVAGMMGCSKKLEEHPYTTFTTDYFKTPTGFQNGINALYSGMRWLYGPQGALQVSCIGTDEFTFGDQGKSGDSYLLGSYGLDPSNGAILTPWNRSFNNINQANMLVTFGPNIDISDAAKTTGIAESRFLRGLYYLGLVQQFGAVPLDLGSGELQFNSKAFQGFNRLPTDSVLIKDYAAMIADFDFASKNLPDQRPAGAFKASKSVALHMLAKTYLQRSYTAYAQAGDVQNAYNAAMELINNQSKYGVGLMQAYSDVHAQGNDYNKELLFAIERIPGDYINNEQYDQTGGNIGIGAYKGIDADNDFNMEYTSIHSPLASSQIPIPARTVEYGRPLRQFAPTKYLIDSIFADKTNDSRYNGTFRTVWTVTVAANGFNVGDTAFVLANTDAQAAAYMASSPKYRMIGPKNFYTNQYTPDAANSDLKNIFPKLSKYEDFKRTNFNQQTGRPFVVAKLSETYLIAAEAALKLGNNGDAVTQINVLRKRAAYRKNLDAGTIAAREQTMLAATPATITLNYILNERSRELCGESLRWQDLSTRNMLVDRVKNYNPDGAAKVQAFHQLRPIPQDQLQKTQFTDFAAESPKYQNPGY